MMVFRRNIFLTVLVTAVTCSGFYDPHTTYGKINGRIMLGGLVAIHDHDGENNVDCNITDISSFGIQRVEAMRYAVQKINDDKDILPGVTLGMEIRDSCGSETRALDESLQFVVERVPVCGNKTNVNTMFGVVGASTSLITAEVANLLRLFRIPLVSYAATSTELSDKSKFDFLLRTVPPDSFQSKAMVDFLKKLKWKSVFALYSSGSYGEHGFESFQIAREEVKDNDSDICIVHSVKIPTAASPEVITRYLNDFQSKEKNVVGIVCYLEVPDIRTLIGIVNTNSKFSKFVLIGSDNFMYGPTSNHSIVFSLHYNQTDLNDFHESYSKLTPETVNKSHDPWFHQYWERKCNSTSNCSLCESSSTGLVCPRDDKITYIIDAVYAFAHALNNSLYNEYEGNVDDLLKSGKERNTHFLNKHLKQVRFKGISENVSFPTNASIARGFYDIIQFDTYGKSNIIATWNAGALQQLTELNNTQRYYGESTCQCACSLGQKRMKRSQPCCWTCDACKSDEYLSSPSECTKCLLGQIPNDTKDGCKQVEVKHIGVIWKVIIYSISILGISITGFTIKTFISFNDTPLVKGSGRELSFVLLSGIMALFCIPFLLLVTPGVVVCGIARFSIGFCLCICYSSLLVKTNRIARIFSGRQDLLFLTPNWQLFLTMFILMPQILIGSIGLIKDTPKKVVDYSFKYYGVQKCNSETPDLVGAIAYNLVLVFLSTFYAFRTRKVPANFNEARYIGFVMYTSIVIWVAFLPVFFGTSSEYKTIFITFDLLMNAATLLVGLFGYKMYIILLRPDKNSRSNSKLRSITFYADDFSEKDLNGTVTIEANDKNSAIKVRFEKSATTSTLIPDDENIIDNLNEDTNENVNEEKSFKEIDEEYAKKKNFEEDHSLQTTTNNNFLLKNDPSRMSLTAIKLHKNVRKTFTL